MSAQQLRQFLLHHDAGAARVHRSRIALIDLDAETSAVERQSGAQAANRAAGDRDLEHLIWHDLPLAPTLARSALPRERVRFLAHPYTLSLLFDHLVGTHEQRVRHGQGECVGGFQVNDQIELGGLLNWKIAGLVATKDSIGAIQDGGAMSADRGEAAVNVATR